MFRARAINTLGGRYYSQIKPTGSAPSGTTTAAASPNLSNVTGLSCVKQVKEPVGPGASPTGAYKVPEYFCYNRFSFTEAEVELAKYRCPQPSALQK